MKTLVYVGANIGLSLAVIYNDFDIVYAFEPDPEMYEELVNNFKHESKVHLFNVACSSVDGEQDLFIFSNRVSTSLSCVSDQFPEHKPIDIIKVRTINLGEFLKTLEIDFIDHYVSDCQGSDLNILKTLEYYVTNRKIKTLFIETHKDDVELYANLDNGKRGFDSILSDNYELCFIALDGRILSSLEELPDNALEWDSYWRLREDIR